jgi:hypothetical protein
MSTLFCFQEQTTPEPLSYRNDNTRPLPPTAKAAAADAISAFHNPIEDPDYAATWSPPYELDYCQNPTPGTLLSKPYGVAVMLMGFSIPASIYIDEFAVCICNDNFFPK